MDKIFDPILEQLQENNGSTQGTGLYPYLRQKNEFAKVYSPGLTLVAE
jgi:hypothetical protein